MNIFPRSDRTVTVSIQNRIKQQSESLTQSMTLLWVVPGHHTSGVLPILFMMPQNKNVIYNNQMAFECPWQVEDLIVSHHCGNRASQGVSWTTGGVILDVFEKGEDTALHSSVLSFTLYLQPAFNATPWPLDYKLLQMQGTVPLHAIKHLPEE